MGSRDTYAPARPRPGALALASVVAAACLLALLLGAGRAALSPEPAEAQSCPAPPPGLAPDGPGPVRFTMLIRINQQVNVDTYANFDSATGGLGGYVRAQDIFVINTRFKKTTPEAAVELANNLRAAFPCNRIIALNGLGGDPTAPGYAYSLAGHPAVWGLLSDFEPMDWNEGRASIPSRGPWKQGFKKAFPRIKKWDGRLRSVLAGSPLSGFQRSGLVPIYDGGWNYGQIAQDLDKKNRRLGGRHLGPLSVQTQDSCADGGAAGFRSQLKGLFDQYRFKTVTKVVKRKGKGGKKRKRKITVRRKLKKKARPLRTNLATQISFSDTPNPSAGMAITKTSAATAAACARAGLKRGGGAFFFFASDDSMRLLFQRPEIASLRPPAS